MDKFEISEDDLRFAFDPQREPRFKMTKAQHTYGVWADDIEEENTPSYSQKGARLFSTKSASGPIGFISGGVTKPTVKTPADSEEESDKEDDEDEYKSTKDQRTFKQTKFQYNTNRSDIGNWEKHTKGIGQKLLLQMGYQVGKGLGKHSQGRTAPVEAVQRKGKGAIGAYGPETTAKVNDSNVGINSKESMLESQRSTGGWRKGGSKKKVTSYQPDVDPMLDNRSLQKMKLKQGETLSTSLPFMATDAHNAPETDKVKVIDMTGRQTKIMLGYESISQRLNKPDFGSDHRAMVGKTLSTALFDLPELRHNLDVLINQSERALIKNQQRLAYETQQAERLREKADNLSRTIEKEALEAERLAKLATFLENSVQSEGTFDDLEQCKKMLEAFKDEFRDEYKLYDLKTLVSAIVYPMLKRYFEDWDPLVDPERGSETLAEWREILKDLESNMPNINFDIFDSDPSSGGNQLYERIMWLIWMPKIRKSLQNWNPRDYEPVIGLIQVWEPLLPGWLLQNLLEQLILPRLQIAVDEWNPLTDVVPIHAWVHPWLPYLDDRLEILYGPIRHKLGSALQNWHPSDASAKAILSPWAPVFGATHFESFLVRAILPKLEACARDALFIDPSAQRLEPFHWLMDWHELLAPAHIALIAQRYVFPKLARALNAWLTSAPNYAQISDWYLGWKSIFPKPLLERPEIKAEFESLLMIMNQSLSNGSAQSLPAPPSAHHFVPRGGQGPINIDTSVPPPPSLPAHLGHPPSSLDHRLSFKELVQRKLEQAGILFVQQAYNPYFPTTLDKQVYKVGSAYCVYIEREVLYMLTTSTGTWSPVSLNDLIRLVESTHP